MSLVFDNLSRAMMDVIYKVKDEESLVQLTCYLIRAKTVVLIERKISIGEKLEAKVLAVYPKEFSELFISQNYSKFWEWLQEAYIPNVKEGVIIEKASSIKEQKFTGGLVAFGQPDLVQKGWRLELVALHESDKKKPYFLSNHTWVCHNLLRQYELLLTQHIAEIEKRRAKEEIKQKELLSSFIGKHVLHDEEWESLEDRIAEFDSDTRKIFHGIWICLQIFKLVNKENIESSGFEKAYNQYKNGSSTEVRQDEFNVFHTIICFFFNLDECRSFYVNEKNRIKYRNLFLKDNFDINDHPLKGQLACLIIYYAWWKVMQQIIILDSTPSTREKNTTEKYENDPSQNI